MRKFFLFALAGDCWARSAFRDFFARRNLNFDRVFLFTHPQEDLHIMFAKKISYLTLVLALMVGLFAAAMPTGTVSAAPIVVYNAVPATLPPNIPSLGFQATQTAEFGDFVHLAGTNRELRTVTVTMSTWALQSTYPAMTDPTG